MKKLGSAAQVTDSFRTWRDEKPIYGCLMIVNKESQK